MSKISFVATVMAVSMIGMYLSGCNLYSNEVSVQTFVFPADSEKRLIYEEQILQENCNGTAEMSQTVERQHTVAHTLEMGGGVTVSVDGKVSLSEIGEVGVGTEVAQTYNVSYGREEQIKRSVRVAAKEGTYVQHTIRQYEIWENGEILLVAGNKNTRLPYSFRRDFAIETVAPANIGCPPPQSVSPTPTIQLPTSSPPVNSDSSQLTGQTLNTLFGLDNWFCFPDRTNGVGVKFLPINFQVQAPLRYIDTFRGRSTVGEIDLGGTGATAELTESLPIAHCPSWQQQALTAWISLSTSNQRIVSSLQLDERFQKDNWGCLSDYRFGVRVFYLATDLRIEFPITTVDMYDGSKHGVGETIPAGGEITVWFAGSIPVEQCP
jgi:hypothetical protein